MATQKLNLSWFAGKLLIKKLDGKVFDVFMIDDVQESWQDKGTYKIYPVCSSQPRYTGVTLRDLKKLASGEGLRRIAPTGTTTTEIKDINECTL